MPAIGLAGAPKATMLLIFLCLFVSLVIASFIATLLPLVPVETPSSEVEI